jgi:hypothetical protein
LGRTDTTTTPNSNSASAANTAASSAVHITREIGDRSGRLNTYNSPSVRQDYETPTHPSGLLWMFTFYDNWSDGYYVGLDQIEFIGVDGRVIDVNAFPGGVNVSAIPHSLQDLNHKNGSGDSGTYFDPRIPEAVFRSQAERGGASASQPNIPCWLAPLSRCMTQDERAAGVVRLLKQQG